MAKGRKRVVAAQARDASDELDTFVEEYFAQYRDFTSKSREVRMAVLASEGEDRSGQLDEMILWGSEADQEAAWPMLLALIERAPDDESLAFVAAGPLEDMILKRHDRFGDRILGEARRNPRFRHALGGVWGWDTLPDPFGSELLQLAETAHPA